MRRRLWKKLKRFIGQMFVDKNKNKIPDILEKDTPPPRPPNYTERG